MRNVRAWFLAVSIMFSWLVVAAIIYGFSEGVGVVTNHTRTSFARRRGWPLTAGEIAPTYSAIIETSPSSGAEAVLSHLRTFLVGLVRVALWFTAGIILVAGIVLVTEYIRDRRIQAAIDDTAPDFDAIVEQMVQGVQLPPRLRRFVSQVKAQRGLIVPSVSELVVSIRIAGRKMREARIPDDDIAAYQFAVGVLALVLTHEERRALQLMNKHGMAQELKRTTAFFNGKGYDRPSVWGVLIGKDSWRDWWEGGFAPQSK
jgi:hypothetical protein